MAVIHTVHTKKVSLFPVCSIILYLLCGRITCAGGFVRDRVTFFYIIFFVGPFFEPLKEDPLLPEVSIPLLFQSYVGRDFTKQAYRYSDL